MNRPTLFDYLDPELVEFLFKTAEEKAPESKAKRIAKTVGSGLVGTGVGYLAGGGAAHLADKLHQKTFGHSIPSSALMGALPVLGAGAGLAYSLYKAQEQEEMRRALESNHHQPNGRVP